MQNMEKLLAWTTPVVVTLIPQSGTGRQEQQWDDRRSQGRFVTSRIRPRRSGLERREKFVDRFKLGIAMDKRHLSLSAPKAVA